MEKQIMIKHRSNKMALKIKEIINRLEQFIDFDDKVICNCRFKEKESNILNEINSLNLCNGAETIKINTNKKHEKYSEYNITFYFKDIKCFLEIVEKYELNIMIIYNDIKVFINDNDGDFIVINSNNEKFNSIKGFKNT